MKSPLQLESHPKFGELSFKVVDNFQNDEQTKFEYNSQCGYKKIEDDLFGIILNLNTTGESRNIPVEFSISATGVFRVDKSLLEHRDFINIVLTNGGSILLGVIRQKVIEITALMEIPVPIVIPIITPNTFARDLTKRRKKISKKVKTKKSAKKTRSTKSR